MTMNAEGRRNHARVYRARGKAKERLCEMDCGAQAAEWSHNHDTDPADPDNYRSLCRKCHIAYDWKPEWNENKSRAAKKAWEENQDRRDDLSLRNLGNQFAKGHQNAKGVKHTEETKQSIRERMVGNQHAKRKK